MGFVSFALRGIALLVLGVAAVGCERSQHPLAVLEKRDLTMLNRMIELNVAHRGMEPFLRNRDRYDGLADTAEAIARMAASDLLVNFPDREEFVRDPQLWHRFRAELESSSEAAAEAARAKDAEALHQAYARMDGSCIGCHKRYLETY